MTEWQHEVPGGPFRAGIEIYRLYGDGMTGPTAALLRFEPGASVSLHEHTGYEHISCSPVRRSTRTAGPMPAR